MVEAPRARVQLPLSLSADEPFLGHKACAGCGGSLAVRLALKVLGERTFVVLPAGCMSAVGFLYPQLAFGCNAIISTFAGTASMMSGIAAAARALKLRDYHVVGFAGDGGTADIGLQALSGAIDRHENFIYICYDNEAYMNTGVQKSGLTPFGARTTTSPAGKNAMGSRGRKKDLFEIVAAHGIDYAATATVAHAHDYIRKVDKARTTVGTSFLHVLAPCPTGWGIDSDRTLEVARGAVDCGLWIQAEYEGGHYHINKSPRRFKPVADHLAAQKRFAHLGKAEIAAIEKERDGRWKRLQRLVGGG
jgi:pyruvate ferredoxin oxidoreductase beta subunit